MIENAVNISRHTFVTGLSIALANGPCNGKDDGERCGCANMGRGVCKDGQCHCKSLTRR